LLAAENTEVTEEKRNRKNDRQNFIFAVAVSSVAKVEF
jgi:hypothetical protein